MFQFKNLLIIKSFIKKGKTTKIKIEKKRATIPKILEGIERRMA
mgnify:CR=1 FL=1